MTQLADRMLNSWMTGRPRFFQDFARRFEERVRLRQFPQGYIKLTKTPKARSNRRVSGRKRFLAQLQGALEQRLRLRIETLRQIQHAQVVTARGNGWMIG